MKRLLPLLLSLAIMASLIGVNAATGEASDIQAIKDHAPAKGHGTVARTVEGRTSAMPAATTSSTWTCDWWGGYLHQYQYQTRLVVMDAYGDCEGVQNVTWSSTLASTSSSTGYKATSVTNTVPEDWRAISKEVGPVPVGEAMNWSWQVYITVPATYYWVGPSGDPAHCQIDTSNQQVMICLYSGGGVIPWYTTATNTPTATPFPTVSGYGTCEDAFAYVSPIPKRPATQTVNMSETYVVGDTWDAQNKGFLKIVRFLRWNNLTTGGTGGYTRNIPLNPGAFLAFYDEQAFVGNGFITVTIEAQAVMMDGERCNMIHSNNVTN